MRYLIITCLTILSSCLSGVRTTSTTIPMNNYLNSIVKFESSDLDKFVVNIKNVEENDFLIKNRITGIVAVNTLINEQGDVDSVFIKESFSQEVDSLVIIAIKDSKFKSNTNNKGKKIKYYIDMTYIFYNGIILRPLVNGKAYLAGPKLAKKVTPDLSDSSGPFDLEPVKKFSISEKPVLLHKEIPVYSPKAKNVGAQGKVYVMITIKANGDVEAMDVLTTDHDLLIISSLDAASKCRFKPAKQRSEYVKVKMSVPFFYR